MSLQNFAKYAWNEYFYYAYFLIQLQYSAKCVKIRLNCANDMQEILAVKLALERTSNQPFYSK